MAPQAQTRRATQPLPIAQADRRNRFRSDQTRPRLSKVPGPTSRTSQRRMGDDLHGPQHAQTGKGQANPGTARYRRPADGRIIVEDRADADDSVGPVDNLPCPRRADLAPINSSELRMVFRKEALGRCHYSDRAADRFCEIDGRLLRASGTQLAADQYHRLLLPAKKRGRCFHRGVQRLLIAGILGNNSADRSWGRTESARDVAGDLDIGRKTILSSL